MMFLHDTADTRRRPRLVMTLGSLLQAALAGQLLTSCGGEEDATMIAIAATNGGEANETDEAGPLLGEVELSLSAAGGIELDRLEWKINGNGYTGGGELIVGRRPVAMARLGGIPIGQGYELWLGSTDDAMTCSGSAKFDVRKSSTTAVRVEVQCTLAPTTGQVSVTAPINVCPIVRGLSAIPLELEVGETAQLHADGGDPDEGPSRTVIRWESDNGTFKSNGLDASLTCVTVGQNIVRVFVSDGACEATAAVSVSCVAVQQRRLSWPGAAQVNAIDPTATFVSNMSGAAYVPGVDGTPGTLWVVQNGPSRIFPMYSADAARAAGAAPAPPAAYSLAAEGPWRAGKFMTYPDGGGEPDSESLTFASESNVVYVATERNNANGGTSRLSILRVVLDDNEPVLRASHEWNVTSQLPRVGSNAGLEGITWIPDDFLVDHGFLDEQTGAAYDPNAYPDHAAGIFFVGVEADGMIHGFALNHQSGEATRVARFSSGQPQVMDVSFDRDTGLLWALCDDTCQGEMTVLRLPTNGPAQLQGRFQVFKAFSRPTGLPNVNNEGLALTPESECNAGLKPIFWTDDNSTEGHSVRSGLMPCGSLD